MKTLERALEFLSSAANDLKANGATSEVLDNVNGAAKLDGEAAKENLTTKAGQDKALSELAAALKLKKKALPLINKLVLATPRR